MSINVAHKFEVRTSVILAFARVHDVWEPEVKCCGKEIPRVIDVDVVPSRSAQACSSQWSGASCCKVLIGRQLVLQR